MAITLTDNEFFSGLSNLALFMRLYATNTSAKPKNFIDIFATDTLANGNKKIFPFADLPTVGDYSETSSLLTVTKSTTNEEVLSISEKKVIKSSYSERILTMAFTSDSGMNEFTGYILGQMESAKENHIYNTIITDLYGKTFTGTLQNKQVLNHDLSAITDFTDLNNGLMINQKNIAKALQLVISNMQVYNTGYNSKAYTQALDLKDLRLIFCEPYHTESIMNLFATLYNSEEIKASFDKPEMVTIPEIKIPSGKENVIGWVLHKYAYQYFYKFVFMGNFFDTSNLCINNFLHFWYGKGWLENLPACKFTAVATLT